MKINGVVLFFLVALTSANLNGSGFSRDKNFIVYAPDKELADQVLARASEFREKMAREWLGKELPAGAGRTIIYVETSATEDSAFTLPINAADRKFHNIWLTTSREKATGSTLRHEIVHAVLNTQFPERLPTAIEEGIASLHDDRQRGEDGQRLIRGFAERGDWPSLKSILDANNMSSRDHSAYSASTSFAEYLLTRGDRQTLLGFGVAGKNSGWDRAAQQQYRARSLAELESGWHAWASNSSDRQPRGAVGIARQTLPVTKIR